MSKTKQYITSTFEEDKKNYSKETGSSTGTNSMDSKTFVEKMINQIKSVTSGSYLSDSMEKLSSITDDGKLLALDSLKKSITSLDIPDSSTNPLKKLGLGAVVKLITTVEKVYKGLLDEVGDTLLGLITIPDPVYVASLIAYDMAGADLEYNGNYIRRLILKRDITMGLEWWNKTWQIEYSGLRSDKYTSDAIISARSGAFKNVIFILDKFYKSYRDLSIQAEYIPNEKVKASLQKKASEIYEMIVCTVKELIVYSYSNFTADELRNILEKYDISPSIFGTNDTIYGGRYTIRGYDIDKMAPFYNDPGAIRGVNKLTENKSSKYRREQRRKGNINTKKTKKFKYINPRNKNVKRIYLTLVSGVLGNSDMMYNRELAERLSYQIIPSALAFADKLMKKMLPSSAYGSQYKLWKSAYDYTREVENYLFDPSNVLNFNIYDRTVIKMPDEVEDNTKIENDDNDQSIIDDKNEEVAEDEIASSIIIDAIDDYIEENGSLPSNLETYIEDVVNRYLSINLSKTLKDLLNEVALGNIIITTSDTIERLIYRYNKENGILFSEINSDQVIPILLGRIRDGDYSIEYLSNNDLFDIVKDIVIELKDDGLYIPIYNNETQVNILKLILDDIHTSIYKIIRGDLNASDLEVYEDFKDRAVIENARGTKSDFGSLTDELYLVTKQLNDNLYKLYKSGVSNSDFNSLTGGKTYDILIHDAENYVNSGAVIEREMDPVKRDLLEKAKELIDLIKTGILTEEDIPEFNDLLNEARASVESKTDLTEVMEILKEFGLKIENYDIIDYYKRLHKKLNENMDDNFFEFDVNNPPNDVLKSLEDEYNDKMNITNNGYYKWRV